jgi:ankyrin repeat protein
MAMETRERRRAGWLLASLLLASAGLGAQPPDIRLIEAARNRNAAAVRTLLKQRVDVNATQPDGATALHWAAYWGDVEVADLLIPAGADVNAQNELNATPLWLACVNGSTALIDRLLRAGADPNVRLIEGETPLMTAARSGNIEAVKLLLARGADVNAKERSRNQTALMWAAGQSHAAVAGVLIEAGADLHAKSEVRRRRINTGGQGGGGVDDRFSPPGVREEDHGGFTALLFAAQQGDVETARVLLDGGANVNDAAANGASALVVAVHSGHPKLARLLLDRGADPNAAGAGYTALHAAILRGDRDSADALLARGANPNMPIEMGTPVRRASRDWSLNSSWIGGTPFWLAARFADVPLMRALAAAGADTRLGLEDGSTPLLVAVGSGVGDRRARGTGNNLQESDPESEQAVLEAVQLILELGADINATTQAGDTALHSAAASGLASVVQLLAEKGAKLDVKNKRGQTPLQMASAGRGQAQGGVTDGPNQAGRAKTVDLLRKLGAVE